MVTRYGWLIVALVLIPQLVFGATWYVRPADDGNGTDLTYGAADGTTYATAFDGFASIAGLSAGDTVCLPGSDEPLFERLVASTAGVTYRGCGTTSAKLWSTQGLSGNRSFNSSRVLVNTAPYAWSLTAAGLWKKRIDVRAQMLWEDTTWLQPVDIDVLTEAAAGALLTAGQWGVRNNGDSTYSILYRPTVSTNTPTNTVIRCDHVPNSDGTPAHMITVASNQTFSHIDVWGYGSGVSLTYPLLIDTSANVTLDTMIFYRNKRGPGIGNETVPSTISNVRFTDVSVLYSEAAGMSITPGTSLVGLTVIGGSFSYTTKRQYDGQSISTSGDGDGIGIGFTGGTGSNFNFTRITANGNANAGIFFGTGSVTAVTNLTISGFTAIGNGGGCFSETAQAVLGTLSISGFLCSGTPDVANIYPIEIGEANVPAALRTVIVANGTFTGNATAGQLRMAPHVNTLFKIHNLVFTANPATVQLDRGDIWFDNIVLIGTEKFSSLYFYSRPNTHTKFSGVVGRNYYYDIADTTGFNTEIGATNTFLNVNPLLTTDYKPQGNSPLRRAGTTYAGCADARGRPCWSPPDIGAYQSSSGDPAATRAVRIP